MSIACNCPLLTWVYCLQVCIIYKCDFRQECITYKCAMHTSVPCLKVAIACNCALPTSVHCLQECIAYKRALSTEVYCVQVCNAYQCAKLTSVQCLQVCIAYKLALLASVHYLQVCIASWASLMSWLDRGNWKHSICHGFRLRSHFMTTYSHRCLATTFNATLHLYERAIPFVHRLVAGKVKARN